jgi:hypothetical protein
MAEGRAALRTVFRVVRESDLEAVEGKKVRHGRRR